MKYTIKSLVGRVVAFLLTLVMLLTGGITSVLAESTPAEADTTPSAETAAEVTTAPTNEAAPQAEADTQTATEAAEAAAQAATADTATDASADAADTAESPAVTINDAALHQAICAALGKDYSDDVVITEAEMQSLTTLTAENAGITDLTGLEKATNLEVLDLSGNDLSGAVQQFRNFALTHLRNADFSNCQLTSAQGANIIKYLYCSIALESVNFSNNQMTGVFDWTQQDKETWDSLKYMDFSNNNLNGFFVSTNFMLASLEKIDLTQNRIWMNENSGDWYANMVAFGTDKFDVTDQKSLTDLMGAYLQGTGSSFSADYVDNSSNIVDFGNTLDPSITFKLQGYGPNQSMTAMLEDADLPVMIATPDTRATLTDNCLINVDLSIGENQIPIVLTHANGETRNIMIKVTRTNMPESGEATAGIKDAVFQKAVVTALNRLDEYADNPLDYTNYDVTKEDMAKLTSLTATDVSDLSGLEYAVNLTSLSLTGTFGGTVDVSVMPQLKSLTLNGQFESVKGISELSGLTTLALTGNYESLESLSNLTSLRTVTLVGNLKNAVDMSTQTAVTTLTISPAADNTIPDLSAMENLATLNVYHYSDAMQWPEDMRLDKLRIINFYNCEGNILLPKIQSVSDYRYQIYTDVEDCALAVDISNIEAEEAERNIRIANDVTVDQVTFTGTSEAKLNLILDNVNRVQFDDDFSSANLTSFEATDILESLTLPSAENLQNLTTIDLDAVMLPDEKLPDSMNNLANVESITIRMSNLSSLEGSDFSNCSKLTTLSITENTGLETDVDSSILPSSLASLNLMANRINTLTGDWSKFTALGDLNLTSNYMQTFPSEAIRQLTGLRILNIYGNLYTDFAENTFENSKSLMMVMLGNFMPVVETESGWQADPNSNAGKAIAQLKTVSPMAMVMYTNGPDAISIPSGTYSGLVDIETSAGTITGDVFTSRSLSLMVPAGTDSVTIRPKALLEDTVITVDGIDYQSGDAITLPIQSMLSTVTLDCYNAYTNNLNLEQKTTYTLSVTAGTYIEDFKAEVGHVYDVQYDLLKINNTTSMADTYFTGAAQLQYTDGQYEIRLTTTSPEWITDLRYDDGSGITKTAEIIEETSTTRTYRIYVSSIENGIAISPRVVPMANSYATCYMHIDLTKVIDITDSVSADKADLNAAITNAETILAGNNVYTDDSWADLEQALTNAKDIAGLETPTQTVIDTAAANLNAAIEGLVVDDSKVADKTALQTALDTAAGLEKGTHTDTAWNTLQDAITAAQAVYDDVTATQAAVDAQTQTLNMAITLFNASGDASELDKNNLADGVYSVYVDMKNASNPAQASMADGAIDHTVKLEVIDGKYYITLDFKGMTINLLGQNFFGYLKNLSYYADGYSIGMGVTGDLLPAEVLSTQKNADGTDVVDSYNDADGDGTADYLYPDQVRFELVPTAIQDDNGYAALQVFVPIMDAISAGSGTQNVFMQIDWSTLKAEDPTPDIDEAAVQAVVDAIDGLGAITSLDQEEQVATVRAAYDLLNADEKALVTNLSVLEAAETAIAELKAQAEQEAADKAAAQAVADLIAALPTADSLTLDDKADVDAARAAYNALTDSQKAYVAEDTLTTLTNAEAKIAELTAAQEQADKDAAAAVDAQIAALPAIDSLTLSDKASVEEARAAYDRLTDTQKGYVTGLVTLESAEARIAELVQAATDAEVAQTVTDQIAALPAVDALTTDDAAKVQAARDAYNKLTDSQKALVSDESLKTLEAAEAKMAELVQAEADAKAAQAVTDQIAALPAVDALTVNDAAKVQAARDAYEALTDSQKELISEESVKALEAAEARMAELMADVPSAGLGGNTLPGSSNLPATTGGINGDTLGKGSNVNTGVANDTANTTAAVGLIAAAGVGAALYSRRRKGSDA